MTLANPRGFCAGVSRAIDVVEAAAQRSSGPVYVLHEIVHNGRVLDDLRARGVRFVEHLHDVPRGATVVFSAHGVAHGTIVAALERELDIVDATCPLVSKVHREVEQYAHRGFDLVLIGHRDHVEVQGTVGRFTTHAGGTLHVIESVEQVATLGVTQPDRVAYATQTTLSVDDTAAVIAALRHRYPGIEGPRRTDICYATQNRQQAVRELAREVELLLVVGAPNSSNSNRLRELGEQLGLRSYLVPDAAAVDAAWFESVTRVGVTAGASAPDTTVNEVLERLRALGVSSISERAGIAEAVRFSSATTLSVAEMRLAVASVGRTAVGRRVVESSDDAR